MKIFISSIIVVSFIVSCAHQQLVDRSKPLKHFCLNSSGNGRVEVDKQKTVFSYETLLNEESKTWTMALSFPLHGQEVIHLALDKKAKRLVEFEGSFKSESSNSAVKGMITKWANFMRIVILEAINQQKGSAQKSKLVFNVDKKEKLVVKNKKQSSFQAKFYNLQDNNFSRIDFKEVDAKQSLGVELIMSECL